METRAFFCGLGFVLTANAEDSLVVAEETPIVGEEAQKTVGKPHTRHLRNWHNTFFASQQNRYTRGDGNRISIFRAP